MEHITYDDINNYIEFTDDLNSMKELEKEIIDDQNEYVKRVKDRQDELYELNIDFIEKIRGEKLSIDEIKGLQRVGEIVVGDYISTILNISQDLIDDDSLKTTVEEMIKNITTIPKEALEANNDLLLRIQLKHMVDMYSIERQNFLNENNLRNVQKSLDNARDEIQEYIKREKIISRKANIFMFSYIIAAALILGGVLYYEISGRDKKANNIELYTTTPDIVNIEKNIFILKLTILGWYYNNINGCYMVLGTKEYKLDDCSINYYNKDLKNLINCSCGTLSKTLELPTCDSDECLKPYCLGKCENSKETTCSTNNNIKKLYKCNNKSIDDNEYVYYYYKMNPLSSIIPQSYIVQKILKEDYIPSSKSKSNILLYILIILAIIFVIFIVLYFIKRLK